MREIDCTHRNILQTPPDMKYPGIPTEITEKNTKIVYFMAWEAFSWVFDARTRFLHKNILMNYYREKFFWKFFATK